MKTSAPQLESGMEKNIEKFHMLNIQLLHLFWFTLFLVPPVGGQSEEQLVGP